jgi:hypothetical protein
VDAIGRFSQRCFGNVEKVQTVSHVPATIPFGDVGWNGVRRLAKLRTQLEPLERRKRMNSQLVESNEEIVRALPSHKGVMTKIHDCQRGFIDHAVNGRYAGFTFSERFRFTKQRPRGLPFLPIPPT